MTSSRFEADVNLLTAVLERSRGEGFLGPVPVVQHVEHARSFAEAAEPPARALDLGSGGGVPGLILAVMWPDTEWTLLDSSLARVRFLTEAVRALDLAGRVRAVHGRAESSAREAGHRHGYQIVVSRSFGPPAVTAECGTGFLPVGGNLLVSEPPGPRDPFRWPVGSEAGLEALGLDVEDAEGAVAVLRKVRSEDPRYPRRPGIPAKRPLW